MTLPYSTNFPKPGDTLTAAQANSLPVGSHVEWLKSEYERRADGWFAVSGAQSVFVDNNLCESESPYTLVRVGPAVAPVETSDDRFATLTQQMVVLKAERDNYAAEQAVLAARVQQEKCRADMLTAERDRLRTENADLLATADALKQESVRSEYWKTLRGQLPDEVACHDNEALVSSAYHWLNEYRQERDAAISEIGKSCATMAAAHADEIKSIAAERDAALARAEAAEARLVVPEDVRKWAEYVVKRFGPSSNSGYFATFILSLADHFRDATKMMPLASTHPEGTWEWAMEQMDAGKCVCTNHYSPVKKCRGKLVHWFINSLWMDATHEADKYSLQSSWRICDDPEDKS